ncbi:hypothetical protein FDUTEX481_00081 [Tolypothrix sp. PCC 7601]|nr:hypothetical protein FDUTEX481_00081 [Tolypothrix sp. PCC 7601]
MLHLLFKRIPPHHFPHFHRIKRRRIHESARHCNRNSLLEVRNVGLIYKISKASQNNNTQATTCLVISSF